MTRMDTPPTEESRDATKSQANRMQTVRVRVRAKPGGKLRWRIGVTIVGVLVVAVGIVLLPLPGPGWLIIFAGLEILATEYVWARRLLRFARARLERWADGMKRRPRWVRSIVGLSGLAFIVAVFAVSYLVLWT